MTLRYIQTWSNFDVLNATSVIDATDSNARIAVGPHGVQYCAYWDTPVTNCNGRLMFRRTLESRPLIPGDWETPVEIVATGNVQTQQPGIIVDPNGIIYVSYVDHDYVADTDTLHIYRSLDEGETWSLVSSTAYP